jgi:hypothetical protein
VSVVVPVLDNVGHGICLPCDGCGLIFWWLGWFGWLESVEDGCS